MPLPREHRICAPPLEVRFAWQRSRARSPGILGRRYFHANGQESEAALLRLQPTANEGEYVLLNMGKADKPVAPGPSSYVSFMSDGEWVRCNGYNLPFALTLKLLKPGTPPPLPPPPGPPVPTPCPTQFDFRQVQRLARSLVRLAPCPRPCLSDALPLRCLASSVGDLSGGWACALRRCSSRPTSPPEVSSRSPKGPCSKPPPGAPLVRSPPQAVTPSCLLIPARACLGSGVRLKGKASVLK